MSLLEIQNGTKIYQKGTQAQVIAFSDLQFSVEQGESLAVMGRSGSGKSTLLHILGGIDRLTEGSCLLEGRDLCQVSPKELAEIRNRKIGFVLQNFGLISGKSVFENIAIPLYFNPSVRKREMKEKIEKALCDLHLEDKRKAVVANLSGGQKQRVAIARAIVNEPEIILADEPTGSLDRQTAEEIMELLLELSGQGKTLVLVTHDAQVAGRCERQFYMK